MASINWKRKQATSLRDAMELCILHAKVKKNLSVEQIAFLIGGVNSHFTLYKWMESGRMPINIVRPFEHVCGCEFVTQFIAYSANKLLISIPTGRKAKHRELNDLSGFVHQVLGMLMAVYEGEQDADKTILSLNSLIEDLAFQRLNVEKLKQPELQLEANV